MAATDSQRLSVTAQGDREIVMSRVFKAPRTLVFDAWTKPELFVRWFGPRGWSIPVCEMDLRVGGVYRYIMRGAEGAEVEMRGVYREVERPARLVTSEAFVGFSEVGWRPEDVTVSTTILSEQDGQTTWTATILYPSQDVRDAALRLEPAWAGVGASFDRLAELLPTLA